MYIALNGTLVARRLDWEAFANIAHSVGFGGVDLLHAEVVDMGAARVKEILDGHNLKPSVVLMPVDFRKDDATFEDTMKKLEPTAALAKAIGCPRMTAWVPSWCAVPREEQAAIWRKRLQAVHVVLEKYGIRLGLEYLGPLHLRKNGKHTFYFKHADMLEFAKSCGKLIGVLVDSWHWYLGGNTVADIAATPRADLVHVQVADVQNLPAEQIRDNERLMPGEGVVDFTAFFGALKKAGYDGAVSPEVFGHGLDKMPPEEGATLGLQTTTAVMKKAGVL